MRTRIFMASILALGVLFLATRGHGAELRADAARMEARIKALSEFGRNDDGGVSRVAYSEADIDGRAYVMDLMRALGLAVRIDSGGNIIGRRDGGETKLKPIMFGSHTDSVPHGGNYDGDVGVIAAIEALQLLHDNNIVTRHPLEVVVFSNEEGGLVGSLAMTGHFGARTLEVVSHSGLTVTQGIDAIGGDHTRLDEAVIGRGALAAFIEVHIEQGAFLDEEGVDIGIVEGIVGIRWWDVTVEGEANHAGTTPMNRRRDAMLAAARLTVAVNEVATAMPGRQVATVGRIRAEPGAPNVVPGRVVMSLEIRDLDVAKMELVFERIHKRAEAIAEASATSISFSLIDVDSIPTPTDERMRRIISGAAQALGLTYKLMPSGAGHDAQDMATIVPTGMIFVPSVGGISPSPREFTSPRAMANGADVLLQSILGIDRNGL